MTKKDLVKALNEGTVRVRIDGEIKQFTRNASKTGMVDDTQDNTLTNAKIKEADSGATIGVYELGSGKLTTITNAEITDIIGHGCDCE
jgi:hypothetical protein